MGLVDVKIDTTSLSRWAQELSDRGFRNALRRAIDKSARAARKVAIDAISKDIGVSKAKIRAATPKVITTKAGDLSARWTVSKMRIGISTRQALRYRVQAALALRRTDSGAADQVTSMSRRRLSSRP